MDNNIINLNNEEIDNKTTPMEELTRKLDDTYVDMSLREMLHQAVDLICDTLFDEIADTVPTNNEEADRLIEWMETKFEGKDEDEIAQMILDKLG